MTRVSLGLVPVLLLSLLAVGASACAADPADDDAATGDEANLTEGSAEAKAVLALVNDRAVGAQELLREARVVISVGEAIVSRRNADPFEKLSELDEVAGVGPA